MVHPVSKKKDQIAGMFNSIAGTYDFLNHLLSLNSDKFWRKKAIGYLGITAPDTILDLATGTGDFAIAALQLHPGSITGIDISSEMLSIGKEKLSKWHLENKIDFLLAAAEEIPFENDVFSAVISAFGVRNFSDLEQGLREAYRVLTPGGSILILEFSKPKACIIKHLYEFYFKRVLPMAGGWISGKRKAYTYLHDSVSVFPEGEQFLQMLRDAGFQQCQFKTLSGGIASMYKGIKSYSF